MKVKDVNIETEPTHRLNVNQELFCLEYIKDSHGTKAAIAAGYSVDTAAEQASRLLKKVNIRLKIRQLLEEQFKRLKIDADMILKGHLAIAKADIRQLYDEEGNLKPIQDWPQHLAESVIGIETEELFGHRADRKRIGTAKKVKLSDRNEAWRDLGRHLKLYTDITEHQGLEGLAEKIKAGRERLKKAGQS